MDNPVETPLPDGGWEKKNDQNSPADTANSTEIEFPVTLCLRELEERPNGSLGYDSDSNRGFIEMYGPSMKVKDVGHVTITNEKGWGCSVEVKGIGLNQSKATAEGVQVRNLVFLYEDDPDGPIFIQKPWPSGDDDMIVRALQPEALMGEGAMVRSNRNRVYVIEATLPRHAKRGYLAVENLAMVETFLGDFNLESRFQSFKDFEDDEGNRAPSFVVEDTRTYVKPKGYYITARPSSEDPTRIICHLKETANGSAERVMRALFPPKSQNSLIKWVKANFPDAKTLLFD